jgi:ribosomal protein L37AE/L43A
VAAAAAAAVAQQQKRTHVCEVCQRKKITDIV